MRLTVALDPADDPATRTHRTVLASLPARFSITVRAAGADLVLVSGDQPGWKRRALGAVGARAVVLAGITALSAPAVRELVEESTVPVAAWTVHAPGPAWAAALPELAAGMPDSAVLDSVSTAPSLRAALVSQLAAVRPLLKDLNALSTAHVGRDCYVLAGLSGAVTVTLAGVCSNAVQLDLDLVGTDRHWHARMDAAAPAVPARISVSDSDGERVQAAVYESPHRAAWAALHDAITGKAPLPFPVDQLAKDLALAEAVLGPKP